MADIDAVVTERQLRAAVLERQRLARRAPAGTDLAAVVRDVGGLQAQYAPTAYIGLWSRLAGFQRAQLTSALERRTVIQATLLRNTIHLVAADDYWPQRIAVRDVIQQWFLRLVGSPSERTMRAAAERVRTALTATGSSPARNWTG